MMFTDAQLALIKKIAHSKKNQGELSVLEALYIHDQVYHEEKVTFSGKELNIIKFCAEECKRQRSGEMSVYDMVNAWHWADYKKRSQPNELTIDMIENLGKIVEPIDNKNGFRTIPIYVGNDFFMIEKAKYYDVPRLLEHLLISYYDPDHPLESMIQGNGTYQYANTSEDVFYLEYEEIHPFRDGNGRTGKILFNYLKGTLDTPQMPPNFFGVSNP